MAEPVKIKFCGLTCEADVEAAVASGASYVGFMFYKPSPRSIGIREAVRLSRIVPGKVCKVAVTVDAEDSDLDRIADAGVADMFQLHGSESAERTREIRRRYGVQVMKAIGVRSSGDLESAPRFAEAADRLLIDAKPALGALPGGNGLAFDWRVIQGRAWEAPWMLAGGLNPANVAAAIRLTSAREVDVSSGVESEPGCKDARRIAAFANAAKEV